MIVYLITNTVSGKAYVGLTSKTPKKRWYRHCFDARSGTNRPLSCAIRKYGEGAFTLEILTEAETFGDACRIEVSEIERLKTRVEQGGYNVTAGGEGALGYRHTEESLAKISKTHSGRRHTAEARAKIAASVRGRIASPATRAKISAAAAAISDETRQKRSQAASGKVHSAETRAKLAAREITDAWRASLLARPKRQATPATRAKMSAAR